MPSVTMKTLIFLTHISFAYCTCDWYYGQWKPKPWQCFDLVTEELGISWELIQYMNPGINIDSPPEFEAYNVPLITVDLPTAHWTTDCPPRLMIPDEARCENGKSVSKQISKSITTHGATHSENTSPRKTPTSEDPTVTTTQEASRVTGDRVVVTTIVKTITKGDGTTAKTTAVENTKDKNRGDNTQTKTVTTSTKKKGTSKTSMTTTNNAKAAKTTTSDDTSTSTDKRTTFNTVSKPIATTKATNAGAESTAGSLEVKNYDCWKAKDYPGHADLSYARVKSTARDWCDKYESQKFIMEEKDKEIMKVMQSTDGVLYKYSVRWKSNCKGPGQDVFYPMGSAGMSCSHIMAEYAWKKCTGNEGVGGVAQAGCLLYQLEAGGGPAQGIYPDR